MIETNDLECMGVFCANMIFIIICMILTTHKKEIKRKKVTEREKKRESEKGKETMGKTITKERSKY